MIAAETPRLAMSGPLTAKPSLFERVGNLITLAARAVAHDEQPTASDEAVWTSIARGL